VGDFGIAAQLEHTLDMKRTCVGSPYYMSPEVCQDLPYNRKSDIWALGCVIFELCALSPAFGGSNLMSIVGRIVAGTPPALPARCSPELAATVRRMLQNDPAARPTAAELLQAPWARACLHAFIARTEAGNALPPPPAAPTAPVAPAAALAVPGEPGPLPTTPLRGDDGLMVLGSSTRLCMPRTRAHASPPRRTASLKGECDFPPPWLYYLKRDCEW
jgi:NIMA (never in mitosis gene a)-related kinase